MSQYHRKSRSDEGNEGDESNEGWWQIQGDENVETNESDEGEAWPKEGQCSKLLCLLCFVL